jgi:hypothetical protein
VTRKREPRFWERLDSRTQFVATVVGILVGLAGLATASLTIFGNLFPPDPTDVAASTAPSAIAQHEVQVCMKRHAMGAAQVSIGPTYGKGSERFIVEHCDWPSSTSADGYTRFVNKAVTLRKPSADLYNTVDRIDAPCRNVSATYVSDHMGIREFVTRRLQVDRVFLVSEHVVPSRTEKSGRTVVSIQRLDEVPLDVAQLVPPPSTNSTLVFVLHSDHIGLFDVSCI